MHSNETKNQFIELRAQGLTLARIASQLGVSKRTLVDWNRQCQSEIRSLHAVELEALHEKLLGSHEAELSRMVNHLNVIQRELAKRNFMTVSTEKLLQLSLSLRREIRDLSPDLSLLQQCPAPSGGDSAGVPDNQPAPSDNHVGSVPPLSSNGKRVNGEPSLLSAPAPLEISNNNHHHRS